MVETIWETILVTAAHGHPITQGSKSLGRSKSGQIFMRPANPKLGEWRQQIAGVAMADYDGQVVTAPVRLTCTFWLRRPKGHYGKHGLLPSASRYPTPAPDLSKLVRAVEDAMTGIVFRDDSQVVEQRARKRYAEDGQAEGVKIRVEVCEATMSVVRELDEIDIPLFEVKA